MTSTVISVEKITKQYDLGVISTGTLSRDFVSRYKQTILGPLWFLIQPLLTSLVFTVIFGNFAQLPTDGLPQMLFYMSGTIMWSYFSSCLTGTSTTFIGNAHLFGKVYFPRLAYSSGFMVVVIFIGVIIFNRVEKTFIDTV